MTADRDWMLVEFQGSYLIAHPDGIKGQKVLRDFHVKVEMERKFLVELEPFHSLRAPFDVYYKEHIKQLFPGMVDLAEFRMVEATELDGAKINDPRAMRHEDLVQYIQDKRYPINSSFYNDQDLRHQVALYEKDKKGQQHLQKNLEQIRGGQLAVSKRIQDRGATSRIQVLSTTPAPRAQETELKAADVKVTKVTKAAEKKAASEPAAEPTAAGLLDDMLTDSAYASA